MNTLIKKQITKLNIKKGTSNTNHDSNNNSTNANIPLNAEVTKIVINLQETLSELQLKIVYGMIKRNAPNEVQVEQIFKKLMPNKEQFIRWLMRECKEYDEKLSADLEKSLLIWRRDIVDSKRKCMS